MSITNKKCQKCSYVRSDADHKAPDYACPKCGAVYAKVEAALRERTDFATAPPRHGARAAGHAPPEVSDNDAQANAQFGRVLEARMRKGTKIAHAIYAGYLFGLAFPLIWVACVITAHVQHSPNNEGWINEHFGWQARTFWFALLWGVVIGVIYAGLGPVMMRAVFVRDGASLVGAIFGGWAFMGLSAIWGAWVLYRIIRGWVSLFKAVAP